MVGSRRRWAPGRGGRLEWVSRIETGSRVGYDNTVRGYIVAVTIPSTLFTRPKERDYLFIAWVSFIR